MKIARMLSMSGLVVVMLLGVTLASAQAPPVIEGDANAQALAVVQAYLDGFPADLLDEDVDFLHYAMDIPLRGRDVVTDNAQLFYGDAFSDRVTAPIRYVVANDTVVAEFQFLATNSGRWAGSPATGRSVDMNIVGIFDVEEEGEITTIRYYYDTYDLYNQLGFVPLTVPGRPPGMPPIPNPDDVEDVVDDYEPGEVVTVTGEVDAIVNANAFVLKDDDLLDLDIDQEYILVLATTTGDWAIDFSDEDEVIVSGTLHEFSFDNLQQQVDYVLDEAALGEYDDMIVILVDRDGISQ